MNGAQFRVSIGKWADATDDALLALSRQSIQSLAQWVVETTPVVTGFLRGSWQPSLNAPAAGAPANAAPAASLEAVLSGMKLGDSFWMINGALYGVYVEFGTSKMAPRHSVTAAIAAWPEIVAAEAEKLGLVPA